MTEHLDSTADPKALQGRIELLADALGRVLVAAGVVREVPMTGPELLVAAETYIGSRIIDEKLFSGAVVKLQAPGRLEVGEPVPREDGRFYIPLHRWPSEPNLSDTVLRVASDAFRTLEGAAAFGLVLATVYNRLPGAIPEGPV